MDTLPGHVDGTFVDIYATGIIFPYILAQIMASPVTNKESDKLNQRYQEKGQTVPSEN